jgi:hypothetical protein
VKFIRLLDGVNNINVEDFNVTKIESLSYDHTTDLTTFKVGKRSINVCGNWTDRFYKFLQSGAVWTDGKRYEYPK